MHVYASINWDLWDLEPVLRTWQDYTTPGASERLTPILTIASGLESLLLMQRVFFGSTKELRRLLQPLLRAGSPQNVTIEEIPWPPKTTPFKNYEKSSVYCDIKGLSIP